MRNLTSAIIRRVRLANMLDCVINFYLASCAYWFALILIMCGIIMSSVSIRKDQINTIRNLVISLSTYEELVRIFPSHCKFSFYCRKNIRSTYTSNKLYFILICIQQDATLHSLFYLETALLVTGGTSTHHQERKQLYL